MFRRSLTMPRPSSFIQGRKFGRLTMLTKLPNNRALCLCDCGTEKSITISHIIRGKIQSCGCLHKELASITMTKLSTKHGGYYTPTYHIWNSMLDRCRNPNNPAYKHYGERGITVCERWAAFENFLTDMGEKPHKRSLDRIDNNKGYSPENCRWATNKEQSNNKRTCIQLTYNGETKNITEWADYLDIDRNLIYSRIEAGWSTHKALLTPSRKKKSTYKPEELGGTGHCTQGV